MKKRLKEFPPFSDGELARMFSEPEIARLFPAILSVVQAAELLQVPTATIYDWSSRGLLNTCSRKMGKHLRIFRDRLIQLAVNDFQHPTKGHHDKP